MEGAKAKAGYVFLARTKRLVLYYVEYKLDMQRRRSAFQCRDLPKRQDLKGRYLACIFS